MNNKEIQEKLTSNFYYEIIDEVYFQMQKLRNMRIRLGISQLEMAGLMKVGVQKIIRMEKGYSKIFFEDYLLYTKIITTFEEIRLAKGNQ